MESKVYEREDGDVVLMTYKDHEANFWELMGKYFAFRDWAHEMGGWQFYSKPGSIWFILIGDPGIIGFCSIINEKTHNYFDNFYIFPEYRKRGYSKILWDSRWEYAMSLKREIRVISDNAIQIKRYEDCGMEFYGMRGHYKKYGKTFDK